MNLILKDFILIINEQKDNYIDYDIYKKNEKIGILQTVNNKEYTFIRQVHIFDEYQRNGYATLLFENLIDISNKNIRLCIATNSNSAIHFWNNFLMKHLNFHIKGHIYELIVKKERLLCQ